MAFSDDSFSSDDDYAAAAETLDLDLMEEAAPTEAAARRAILSVVPDADRDKVHQLLELFVLRNDKYNSSPLLLALSMRRLEVCRALLTAGADPNIGSRKQSPLHLAAERGQDDALQMLIDAGVDKEKADSHGCTPLMRACDMGHATVARTLLTAGAIARAREHTLQSTPLLLAATKGHVGVVQALLEHGALHNLSLHNDTDRYNQSPMYVASGEGHVAVVRALIDAGADVKQEEPARTPLHIAAYGGHAAVIWALMEAGADPYGRDSNNLTPVDTAREEGHVTLAADMATEAWRLRSQAVTMGLHPRLGAASMLFLLDIELVDMILKKPCGQEEEEADGGEESGEEEGEEEEGEEEGDGEEGEEEGEEVGGEESEEDESEEEDEEDAEFTEGGSNEEDSEEEDAEE